jgi:hypothetical protein
MPIICEWGCQIDDAQYKMVKAIQTKYGFRKDTDALRYILGTYREQTYLPTLAKQNVP